MARTKSKRELKFQPKFKDFIPVGVKTESIDLLHEEIEAIYLMDFNDLYQEDAALSMGVSRTTFSRIIKSARTKIATALINGKGLHVRAENQALNIALICDDEENFHNLSIHNRYIVFVQLFEGKVLQTDSIVNPLYQTDLKPAIVLTKLLNENGVNYLITPDAGEGFKSALLTKGIFIVEKEYIKKDELQTIL
ncbi:DUF134 domain-containing protein [bacterium]|nr:DUF134 domain-containing protein [bacterium]MBU1884091.1 DUF134 domain-containing protein [bacterium]